MSDRYPLVWFPPPAGGQPYARRRSSPVGLAKETIDLLIPIRALVSLEDQNFALLEPDSPLFQEGRNRLWAGCSRKTCGCCTLPGNRLLTPDLTAPGTWQWEFPLAFSLDHWHDLLRHEGGDSGTAPAMAKRFSPRGEAYVAMRRGLITPGGWI